MGKSSGRDRRKRVKPDEHYSNGPIEVARFGRLVAFRSNFTTEEFAALQKAHADRLPKAVADISSHVEQAAELVAQLPPDRLMHRAWWGVAASHMMIDSETQVDETHTHDLRMVDYVQSLIASVPRAEKQKDDVSEEDWTALTQAVTAIFDKHNYDYQICKTAKQRADNPSINPALEEFRYKAEMFWVNVRGKRYQFHDPIAIAEELGPHSAVFEELFGVSSSDLVTGLSNVWRSLTFGIQDAANAMDDFHDAAATAFVDLRRDSSRAGEPTEAEWAALRQNNDIQQLGTRMAGLWHGLDLFDVGKLTGWPPKLLDELSWAPGDEREFFTSGELRGWPLRVWPVFKRPFLKLGSGYYCFDIYSLFDNFYRIAQRTVFRLKPSHKDEWSRVQQQVSEELPRKYFAKLLPGAQQESNVYYKWRPAAGSPARWFEVDGIVTYADHLFVVEIKAGAFTYTSPATDLQAQISSLENLILNPSRQGLRFLDYLKSADSVVLYDKDHNPIGELRLGDFRHITVCAVTLDAFTEIAAQSQHVGKLGLTVPTKSVWSISIDDLRVYSDMFDNPILFLHFVEQRMRAQDTAELHLNDELDHLGLYVAHNNYGQFVRESVEDLQGRLDFTGFRAEIDKRFSTAVRDGAKPVPILQEMHPRLAEVVRFLSVSEMPERSRIASFLLDVSGEFRTQFFEAIETDLDAQVVTRKPKLLSSHGGVRLTLYCRLDGVTPPNEAIAIKHTRSVMVMQCEADRQLLELVYDQNRKLRAVTWREVDLRGLSLEEMNSLKDHAERIRLQRLANAKQAGKVGRNDQCPCGSGRKYKKCCLAN